MSDKQEFLKELKTLLEKHKISIEAGTESDPQAIHGCHIEFYNTKREVIYRVDDWYLNHSDIE
jgi:hypothetical protein